MTCVLTSIRTEQPLIHCITNIVVANFQANGLLALGASPVMADAVEEAAEIASKANATVLNIGTLKKDTVEAMLLAGKSANTNGKPLVLDPVGAGATAFRKQTVLTLLQELDITLIRCNAGELAAIAGIEWQAKGVDAGTGDANIVDIAKEVANTYNCLVAVSGEIDTITDGTNTHSIKGGHESMSRITGMGCLLSSVTGAFLAVATDNKLDAVAEALLFYKKVGERAAATSTALGTFAAAFINELQRGEK